MFALFWLTVVSFVMLAAAGGTSLRHRREEARRFEWEFGTYQDGRLVHAVPIGDGDHIEDRPSDCRCGPWTEQFERGDGSYGRIIYHQRLHR